MKSKRIKSKENTPFKKSSEENHATKKTGYINRQNTHFLNLS